MRQLQTVLLAVTAVLVAGSMASAAVIADCPLAQAGLIGGWVAYPDQPWPVVSPSGDQTGQQAPEASDYVLESGLAGGSHAAFGVAPSTANEPYMAPLAVDWQAATWSGLSGAEAPPAIDSPTGRIPLEPSRENTDAAQGADQHVCVGLPEPASIAIWSLISLGWVGLGMRVWRRRRTTSIGSPDGEAWSEEQPSRPPWPERNRLAIQGIIERGRSHVR